MEAAETLSKAQYFRSLWSFQRSNLCAGLAPQVQASFTGKESPSIAKGPSTAKHYPSFPVEAMFMVDSDFQGPDRALSRNFEQKRGHRNLQGELYF